MRYVYLFRGSSRSTHGIVQPLMRALAKLVSVNHPDRVFFVGEALVGNEAVDQLSKFDRALRDFSGIGGVSKGRGIDGMIVTKWDTVDDKVRSPSFLCVTQAPMNTINDHRSARLCP